MNLVSSLIKGFNPKSAPGHDGSCVHIPPPGETVFKACSAKVALF